MKQHTPDTIKILLWSDTGGSGKTALAEAMLFFSKATDRLGKIAGGNTIVIMMQRK